ncbi:VOC family protein [Phenylobacterium sp.]|uniref:VOC family protein n=1 Tax=Phenylobacterium sp. TaxID=1871053 RepID=UPI002B7EF89B|nr:VOC family protein [Phenylobacterium sp.]HLZ73573.1 VOC family protein [Phenylobacterium sp.]
MPELTGVTPYFEVFDMTASVAFYCDLLGFRVVFASPEVETAEGRFSHFVRLGLGGLDLMLNTAYDANERPPTRSEPRWAGCRHTHLYLDCDDVPALYAEMTARGLQAEPPAPTQYGYLAFHARDPDGFRLVFHQPLPGTPEAEA